MTNRDQLDAEAEAGLERARIARQAAHEEQCRRDAVEAARRARLAKEI